MRWDGFFAACDELVPELAQKLAEAPLMARIREKIHDGKWTGAKNSDGYPCVKVDGKTELVSRVLKKPSPGSVVSHKDNNPAHVSANNLKSTDQGSNLQKMHDEGRHPKNGPS